MPKLWTETIDAHRREVRLAILNTAGALATEHGPSAVTMAQVAEQTGIGRATLYKYFPDVESILTAWHAHQVGQHLEQLSAIKSQPGKPIKRLEAVMEAYALISHQHHGSELASLMHRGEHVTHAQKHLTAFIRDLIAEGAATGDLRSDIASEELASYCLHALTAASALPSKAAVSRLVQVTLAGLRPTR